MAARKLCTIAGCSKPNYGHGYCSAHYQRWRRVGHPLKSSKSIGVIERKTTPELTRERLKDFVHYDPESGVFLWKERLEKHFQDAKYSPASVQAATWNKKYAGKRAGRTHGKGYVAMTIERRGYLAHRLAWLYVYGEWPVHIDHINRDKQDNRIANLRSVDNATNHRNMPKLSTNTSGVTGVRWHKQMQKWAARINTQGREIYLGLFENLEDAVKARAEANRRFGFHPSHGDQPSSQPSQAQKSKRKPYRNSA